MKRDKIFIVLIAIPACVGWFLLMAHNPPIRYAVYADDGPKPKTATIPIPEKELVDIRQKINAAQQAIDGYNYLESLIVDKESPCLKQLLRQAESDRSAKINAYQATYYSLRDKLLKDDQKNWQPDYQLGVFQAPMPTPPKP
ncbi:MAG: hypothetical protein AB1631_15785 [Acidobacteriota bacterium]